MNLQDLMEKLFIETGHPDTGSDRPDYLFQQYKDCLNTAQDEIAATCAPSMEHLIRETTLSIIGGTQDYMLGDWVQRPLSMWTQDIFAHKVRFRRPGTADRDGSRNTVLVPYVLGPYMCSLLPRTNVPALSGAAGSSTGATATEGALTVVFGASNAVLTAAVVGRMLRLNGESADYLITAQDGSHTVTVDRPIVSRVRGLGVSNLGPGYAATTCRWEIGPVGRFQLRFLPTPKDSSTLFLRYMAYPRKLIHLSDTPELQEDMHYLIWKGALRAVSATKQNDPMYQMYTNEYATAIALLKASDIDDTDSSDGPHVEMLGDDVPLGVVPGTYSRFGGGRFGY